MLEIDDIWTDFLDLLVLYVREKFCWQNNITNADVIQTVFNITTKNFYNQYKVDRGVVSLRLDTQPPSTKNYFGLEDKGIIENGKKKCASGLCNIDSPESLQTYVKYCTFEPTICWMQEFSFAKQWKRPIAEMNILIQQWVFTTDDIQNLNIEDFAQWSFVVDILWRVKERSQCIDTNDIDNDWITDYNDNCYLIFNPTQRDNDQDKIGDVCDDDLDNDWIKNPIWIVDDAWNIVYDRIKEHGKKPIDNCLFIVNQSQLDEDGNNVWNMCDINDRIWISITPRAITQNRFAFVSQYSWSLKNFVRFFGDRNTGSGESALHTYRTNGQYSVRVEATTPKGTIVSATTTVNVWWLRAALIPAVLIQNVWQKVQYTIQLNNLQVSDIDYVEIQWWDWRMRQLRGQDIIRFIDSYTTYWWFCNLMNSIFKK